MYIISGYACDDHDECINRYISIYIYDICIYIYDICIYVYIYIMICIYIYIIE